MSPPQPSPSARRTVAIAASVAAAATLAALLTAGQSSTTPSITLLGGYAAGYVLAAWRHRARAHAQISAAQRDALTGLPNRAVAEQLLADATGTGTPVAVALADVDGLHAVNANFGHAAGDQYLTAVAERLARAVPDGATLARQGGDEFVLIAPHIEADALATAIGSALAGPAVIAGYRLQPRASVGIADSHGGNARHTLARADAAMYSAKHAGGNAILTWAVRRDGEPAADGTRPAVRRRDLIADSSSTIGWAPPHDRDELVALLVSAGELRLLRDALHHPDEPPAASTGSGGVAAQPAGQAITRARLAARLNDLLDVRRGTEP